MYFRCLRILLAGAFSCLAADPNTLRVCADPNNLPYSNEHGQGFENKLAQLLASSLDMTLEYTWWAQRKSFVRNSLNEGRCDVLMEVPSSLDSVEATRPYYRSSYVFVSRRDRDLQIKSLADPRLATWRIGIHVVGDDYAPPASALAARGITQKISGFSLFGAYGESDPSRKIIDAVERGAVDLAIVWGPIAGYFAKSAASPLVIQPVLPPAMNGIPFVFDMSIGVRKGDNARKAMLEAALTKDSAQIAAILAEYGVPQVP